jgi:hypothetical protein
MSEDGKLAPSLCVIELRDVDQQLSRLLDYVVRVQSVKLGCIERERVRHAAQDDTSADGITQRAQV